jgi:hypothetical protein
MESDSFLADLGEGKPGTAVAMHKRLVAFLPQNTHAPYERSRLIQQLRNRAAQLEDAKKAPCGGSPEKAHR